MIAKWEWLLVEIGGRLWVRAAIYVAMSFIVVLMAFALQAYVPDKIASSLGSGAVDAILSILATSLLAVTTFSIQIMVSATSGAAQIATPRSTKLLLRDNTAQNVLATFLGTFLFSLVGIIALQTNIYTNGGRLLLFAASLAVVALLVFTFVRWIAHLSNFGRMSDIASRVEHATEKAIVHRMEMPFLGGRKCSDTPPENARAVFAPTTGYLQHLDTIKLSGWADQHDLTLYLVAMPGSFVTPASTLIHVVGASEKDMPEAPVTAFTIGDSRDFRQDPLYGLNVMAEIASRALSPAVNDPGTAIDILGRGVRVISKFIPPEDDGKGSDQEDEIAFPRLLVPDFSMEDVFSELFRPIARDGAGIVEVQKQLQEVLIKLADLDADLFGKPARGLSAESLDRARLALSYPGDIAAIEAVAAYFDKN